MTPEEINTAIAESLGWTVFHGTLCAVVQDKNGEPEPEPIAPLPDYHASLDACAEFEATLTTPFDMNCYAALVFDQLSEVDQTGELDFCMITATAPQRCKAYLKLKGLWKEGAK